MVNLPVLPVIEPRQSRAGQRIVLVPLKANLQLSEVHATGNPSSSFPEGGQADRKYSATRQCWSKGSGGGDAFMQLCWSSSGCEARPAQGEPARASSKPGVGLGNKADEA